MVHDEATRNRVDVRITQTRVLKGWHHDEFQLMYQPVIRAADNSIAGFEALLRWRDPGASGTFIQPDHFVHLLERLGLMVPVGQWVLTEACTQMKTWNDRFADRPPLFVSVNLGARQIAQSEFAGSVVAALDASGLEREQLVVDITEDALRYNKAGTWDPIRGVKFLGVRAGLDDFGTGEAGLSYLRELQVDFLSIHRKFMAGLGQVEEHGHHPVRRGARTRARDRHDRAGCRDRGPGAADQGDRARLPPGLLLRAPRTSRDDRRAARGGTGRRRQ
ncbi:MAG: EAL domain-containing protein [Acidimicrobiia bacterium]|nr:EAL domain-containing protein [Acidimicrobiia bacterium]